MHPTARFCAIALTAAVVLAACVPERPAARAGLFHGHARTHAHHAWCDDRAAERFAMGFAMARDELRLSPAQETALGEVQRQVEAASGDLARLCAGTIGAERTLIGEFTRAEAMLDAGADAVRRLRPSLEAFDATLDDRQRRTLHELLRRHRG